MNSTQLTQTNSVMGSVHYLLPEQANGKGSTLQSDIYSIGVVLFDSLVVLDQEKYPHFNGYQKEYLENIDQYINDSLFINSSPVTSYYQLKDTLIYILKKCLIFLFYYAFPSQLGKQ